MKSIEITTRGTKRKSAILNDTSENINAALLQAFKDISLESNNKKGRKVDVLNVTTKYIFATPPSWMFKGFQQVISIDELIDKV